MRLRPDFTRTATGYFWLDWLTAPYWAWADYRTRRSFYLLFGKTAKEGRDWLREHWKDEKQDQVGEPG